MRIAFLYDALYPESKGGVERRTWELARRLVGRGHTVHLLVPKAWRGADRVEREGVVVQGVARARDLYTNGGRRSAWQALAYASGLAAPLSREAFDVIDCQIPAHLGALAGWGSSALRRRGAGVVVTWHEAWGRHWTDEMGVWGHAGRLMEAGVARLPATHVAASQHTADFLAGLGRTVQAVIPGGVDLERIASISPDGLVADIVFVGRLVPSKNLGLLIEAVGSLSDQGLRARVLVIGEGPLRSAWEEQARARGVGDLIRFVGSLASWDEVVGALKASKVLALPSLREGFGLVALEAAACGLPVVTLDHPRNAARHLVEAGRSGLRTSEDPRSFALALREVLADDELRRRMGAAGRRLAHLYGWDSAVTLTEHLYEETVA